MIPTKFAVVDFLPPSVVRHRRYPYPEQRTSLKEVKADDGDAQILDLFGPICVAYDDGVKLFDQIRPVLERGETICLDFSGVTRVFPSFLSPAIGCLYAYFTKEDLEKRLAWKGLDATHEALIPLIQRKGVLFYSVSPGMQEELLNIDRRLMEVD